METLIIVSSTYWGNTMKIAKVMAAELNARLTNPEDITQTEVDKYSLIGIGSGIKFASHDKAITNLTKCLSLKGKNIFLFSTRCRPHLGKYHANLKSCIESNGGKTLGEFSCVGFDRTGPWVGMNGYNKNRPNTKDLFKARLFAVQIRKKANQLATYKKKHSITDTYKGLEVRDSVFGTDVMLNTATCIHCEKCLDNCPLSVFAIDNNKVLPLAQNECIMCGNCAKNCPTDSIYINESFLKGLKIMFREGKLKNRYWSK